MIGPLDEARLVRQARVIEQAQRGLPAGWLQRREPRLEGLRPFVALAARTFVEKVINGIGVQAPTRGQVSDAVAKPPVQLSDELPRLRAEEPLSHFGVVFESSRV